ncbi:MAG TPA: DUF1289 domain-containing protein [Woeseiaceae bacterium]|nr:DUF1289 domain-containing protein [Woeseiaceae bacterium]
MDQTVMKKPPLRRPASPCVNICTLDERDVCTGCLRTLDEIGAWSTLSPEEQWRVVDALAGRAAMRRAGP